MTQCNKESDVSESQTQAAFSRGLDLEMSWRCYGVCFQIWEGGMCNHTAAPDPSAGPRPELTLL